jgi:hypothetical protein
LWKHCSGGVSEFQHKSSMEVICVGFCRFA